MRFRYLLPVFCPPVRVVDDVTETESEDAHFSSLSTKLAQTTVVFLSYPSE